MALDSMPDQLTEAASPLDEWGRLMAAALDGHKGAYNRLLGEIQPWLERYFMRRLPMSIAEDLAQDCLIAVHQKRHTYEPGRPFRPWLATIARYKWIDRLRAMGRRPTVSIEDEFAEPHVEGHERSVTSAIVLEELLTRLRPAQTAVIRLVKLQGFSIEEAAAMTGQSESLVKVNIHRGLAKLSGLAAASAE
ncbi:RNA polymerase sigma-70 factor (ECF subfamily) [Blastomonas natatoria]|uniref:RNA polymerase sigma-70 factor (ECF subfamily) n=1 Tax=Blastomonas natatoria TaxID=34015 RepID=A0A2V3V7U3_9SPHN|nr:sigma-70 family RNA polymerase sigma factor [Blastomonas natatoria]PXW77747.1 RNA polymerase sigma-70 factor (ECF subfamily) [Blastomonas natatoria]